MVNHAPRALSVVSQACDYCLPKWVWQVTRHRNGTPTRGRRGRNQGPTVKTYIERAFEARPGQVLNVAEIRAGAEAAGWTTESADPDTIIRTNLRRLVLEDVLVRDANGQYRCPGTEQGRLLAPIQGDLAASSGGA